MSMSDFAAEHSLDRVGARASFFAYMREVWRRRDFTVTLARYRMRSANERNRLGQLWVLLRPSFSALIYGLVFGFILAGSRPPNFVPYVIIGVFMLEFYNSSMNGGAKSIISNTALVQSLPFPRMVLPLAKVLEEFFNFIPTLLLMAILVMIGGDLPNLQWLLMIPLVALFAILNTGVALVFARLTVHFRDLSQFTPFISRMIFYTSGVFFNPLTLVEGRPILKAIFDWHPLFEVLSLGRGILMGAYEIHWNYWWHLSVWAFGMLIIGTIFFWRAEERYGREN